MLVAADKALVCCSIPDGPVADADTLDVYAATNGKVRLIDFNPAGGFTAPLLFDWDDLGYGASHALLLQ